MRLSTVITTTIATAAICFAVAACGSADPAPAEGNNSAGPDGAGFQLGSPAQLAKNVSGSTGQLRLGAQFEAALPNLNVSVAGDGAVFAPLFVPPSQVSLADTAYAVYAFDVAGITGTQPLEFSWTTAPVNPPSLYIGLGNQLGNSWDWSAWTGTVSQISDIEPYVSTGGVMLIATVLASDVPASLAYILVGEELPVNQEPVAILTGSPLTGTAPLLVTFDASASSDTDGSIVKYEYDWESTGTFEELSANEQHTYDIAGNHDCTLRVTDDLGATATDMVRITITDSSYDEHEDNDNISQANALPGTDFVDFSANLGFGGYDGDSYDWFQVELTEGYVYTIDLYDFPYPMPNLMMNLYMSDGVTPVATGGTYTPDKHIEWYCPESGTYYLWCWVFEEGMSNYHLSMSSDGPFTPPVADFVADVYSGQVPLTVNYDASGSYDPDGTIVKYEWDVTGSGSWNQDTGTDPYNDWTFIITGTFHPRVRVTDDDGTNSVVEIEVIVHDGNEPPVADFTATPDSGERPLVVELDASASYDPEGFDLAKYQWDFDGNGLWDVTVTDGNPIYMATYYSPGTYQAELWILDEGGASDSTVREITVTGGPDSETEPNDDGDPANSPLDAAAANTLPFFPFDNFFGQVGPSVAEGDYDDWYVLQVTTTGDLDLACDFFDPICDLAIALYTGGDYDTPVAESNASDTDIEQLTLTLAPGEYFLRVFITDGWAKVGGYKLSGTLT